MRGVDNGAWRNLKGFGDWGRLGLMENSKNSLSMKFTFTVFLLLICLSVSIFGQSKKPQTIIVPTGSLGEISETRIKILEKTLESKLDDFFAVVPKQLFEEAQEKAFQELDYDECTEDQCIMMIQEMLQIENAFQLKLIAEEGDTQISLTWTDLDQKRVEEDFCEGCKTKQLRNFIFTLVDKLLSVNEQNNIVTIKDNEGVLYSFIYKGKLMWSKKGDDEKDEKYVGEIFNDKPHGKGMIITPDDLKRYVGNFKNGLPHGIGIRIERNGEKYDGEWKKGVFWEGTAFDSSDNILGKKVNGNWE